MLARWQAAKQRHHEGGLDRVASGVQKCKPAYGLCKGAKVGCNVSGGGWQPQATGGGVA